MLPDVDELELAAHKRLDGRVAEHVDGLGAKKIQTLLRYFGGMQQIRHASQDELSAIPGIGPELARRIVESFRRN